MERLTIGIERLRIFGPVCAATVNVGHIHLIQRYGQDGRYDDASLREFTERRMRDLDAGVAVFDIPWGATGSQLLPLT